LTLIRLQQRAKMRKLYIAKIPKWRQPLTGYLVSIPLAGLALIGVILGKQLLPSFYFPDVLLLLAVVMVALFWGVGPALFAVLLGAIELDYFYLPPSGYVSLMSWYGMLQIFPFIASGIIIAIITGQRESARLQALFAEQMANERAEELEQSNQQLEQTNQLKDQFISMASHELKTPITTIRGQAQIMLRRLSRQREIPKEFEDVRVTLEKIDAQTHRLTSLVDDLLDLSTMRAGKIDLRLEPCDIREVCRGVVEDQRQLTGRPIELEIPTTSVMAKVDSDRLGQVVTNLVSNAVKYSPDESAVQVCVFQQERVANIHVHDAGQGIPEEQQKRIFETFYRAPDAQTLKKSGWGLGLAICKDIVERHGGRIWCESQVGKGSTFCVELPL